MKVRVYTGNNDPKLPLYNIHTIITLNTENREKRVLIWQSNGIFTEPRA